MGGFYIMKKNRILIIALGIAMAIIFVSCGNKTKSDDVIISTTEGNQKQIVQNKMETFDTSKITKMSIWLKNEEKFTENKELIQQFFNTDCKYKLLENYDNQLEGGLSFCAYDETGKMYSIIIVGGNKFGITGFDGMGVSWYEVSDNPNYSEITQKIKQENGIAE